MYRRYPSERKKACNFYREKKLIAVCELRDTRFRVVLPGWTVMFSAHCVIAGSQLYLIDGSRRCPDLFRVKNKSNDYFNCMVKY